MTDPAFNGVGQTEGLTLWRIEKGEVVLQPEANGKFHEGDAYILLATLRTRSALEWNIHFWLGAECSQDEQGIAAYKTVELDESLGGGPIQYREVQGNESSVFLSYFKNTGVEYLPGGVDSGFRHVDRDAYETRLLHVKGSRTVRVNEVPCSNASLNTGDVFILDMGLQLFLYNGEHANRQEKAKGIDVIRKIKNDERGAKASITVINEDPNNQTFWGALGGQITVTNPGEDDDAADASAEASLAMYRISDASGAVEFTLVEEGSLHRENLDTNDVFLVDTGSQVFVWTGRGSTLNEKKEGMIRAVQYLADHGRPNSTPVQRVAEDAESSMFKALFSPWDPPMSFNFGGVTSSGIATNIEQKEIDFAALHQRQEAEDTPVDDGSGTLQVWRIEDFEMVAQPEELHGQFFAGDCYVLLYTYMEGNSESYIIYFWQGNQSTTDERGASALKAKELDDQYQDKPVQVRVVQGKEPAHFRSLFQGSMIIHSGGKASGFSNRDDQDSYDTDGIALFHVKGTTKENTIGVQVEEKASSLNSGDCFVLVCPTYVYIWVGQGANDAEVEVATGIANTLANSYLGQSGRELYRVDEGQEDEDFWNQIGGRGEYPQTRPGEPVAQDPRLFQCSNATGSFRVDEIPNYTQEDLIDDDVMLLDTFTTVFVWVGSQSNDTEKSESLKTAQAYIDHATDGRDADTPIIRIRAGREPKLFTQHFLGWDPEMTKRNMFVDPYQARLAELHGDEDATAASQEENKVEEEEPEIEVISRSTAEAGGQGGLDPNTNTFPLDVLQSSCPDGVDPSCKEMFLDNGEFQSLFGMDKQSFEALPKWKRQKAKKDHGLF